MWKTTVWPLSSIFSNGGHVFQQIKNQKILKEDDFQNYTCGERNPKNASGVVTPTSVVELIWTFQCKSISLSWIIYPCKNFAKGNDSRVNCKKLPFDRYVPFLVTAAMFFSPIKNSNNQFACDSLRYKYMYANFHWILYNGFLWRRVSKLYMQKNGKSLYQGP